MASVPVAFITYSMHFIKLSFTKFSLIFCNFVYQLLLAITIDKLLVSMLVLNRGKENKCLFLHVDVVLQGATFFAVFTDADQLPTPYRIDNLSEVFFELMAVFLFHYK